jgi:plastocyanin
MSDTYARARRGQPTASRRRVAPPRRTRKAVITSLCAVVLAILTGCGSSAPSGGAASGSSAPAAGSGTETSSAAEVTIKGFAFTTPASVSPGAKVNVNNMDGVTHTVTADTGNAFDSEAPAWTSSFTAPTAPGSYPFHCSIHPQMHGTLVVK